MKKRVLALLLAGAAVASLAACGSSDSGASGSGSAAGGDGEVVELVMGNVTSSSAKESPARAASSIIRQLIAAGSPPHISMIREPAGTYPGRRSRRSIPSPEQISSTRVIAPGSGDCQSGM